MNDKILKILEPYKNDGYFNIAFYQRIGALGFINNEFRDHFEISPSGAVMYSDSEEVIEKLKNENLTMELALIFSILDNWVSFNCDYNINIVKDYYYRLTKIRIDNNVKIESIFRNMSVWKAPIFKVNKQKDNCYFLEYDLYVNNDVIACEDKTNDIVNFGGYIDDTNNISIIKKNSYNNNDINILHKIVNYLMRSSDIASTYCKILEYYKYICNFYGEEIYSNSKLQEITKNFIFIFIKNQKYMYMPILVKRANAECLLAIINDLPTKYFKYIKKRFIPIILNSRSIDFKTMICLSVYLKNN